MEGWLQIRTSRVPFFRPYYCTVSPGVFLYHGGGGEHGIRLKGRVELRGGMVTEAGYGGYGADALLLLEAADGQKLTIRSPSAAESGAWLSSLRRECRRVAAASQPRKPLVGRERKKPPKPTGSKYVSPLHQYRSKTGSKAARSSSALSQLRELTSSPISNDSARDKENADANSDTSSITDTSSVSDCSDLVEDSQKRYGRGRTPDRLKFSRPKDMATHDRLEERLSQETMASSTFRTLQAFEAKGRLECDVEGTTTAVKERQEKVAAQSSDEDCNREGKEVDEKDDSSDEDQGEADTHSEEEEEEKEQAEEEAKEVEGTEQKGNQLHQEQEEQELPAEGEPANSQQACDEEVEVEEEEEEQETEEAEAAPAVAVEDGGDDGGKQGADENEDEAEAEDEGKGEAEAEAEQETQENDVQQDVVVEHDNDTTAPVATLPPVPLLSDVQLSENDTDSTSSDGEGENGSTNSSSSGSPVGGGLGTGSWSNADIQADLDSATCQYPSSTAQDAEANGLMAFEAEAEAESQGESAESGASMDTTSGEAEGAKGETREGVLLKKGHFGQGWVEKFFHLADSQLSYRAVGTDAGTGAKVAEGSVEGSIFAVMALGAAANMVEGKGAGEGQAESKSNDARENEKNIETQKAEAKMRGFKVERKQSHYLSSAKTTHRFEVTGTSVPPAPSASGGRKSAATAMLEASGVPVAPATPTGTETAAAGSSSGSSSGSTDVAAVEVASQSYMLAASTEEELDKWMRALRSWSTSVRTTASISTRTSTSTSPNRASASASASAGAGAGGGVVAENVEEGEYLLLSPSRAQLKQQRRRKGKGNHSNDGSDGGVGDAQGQGQEDDSVSKVEGGAQAMAGTEATAPSRAASPPTSAWQFM